MYRRKDKRS